MKKKNIMIILIVIIAIVLIGVLVFIKNERRRKLEDSIANEYSEYIKTVNKIQTLTDKIYNEHFNNLVISTFPDKYEDISSDFANYSKLVTEIDSYSILKNNCLAFTSKNQDIQNKCDAFVINYEQIVNTYVKDAADINLMIDKVNSSREDNKLEPIKVKPSFYIDYNKDGKYLGKDNEAESE